MNTLNTAQPGAPAPKAATSAPFLAQAASSTDPDVLQALADGRLLERYFFHLRTEFLNRVTGDTRCYCRWGVATASRITELVAVEAEEKPGGEFGRWKQGPSGRGWVPAANSKMEEEFEALNAVPYVPIPGTEKVQGVFMGNYLITPTIFALDGKAWLRFSDDPSGSKDLHRDDYFIGTNWVRERNSDAVRAMEDWDERYSKRPHPPLDDSEQERVDFLFERDRRRKEEQRAKSQSILRRSRR